MKIKFVLTVVWFLLFVIAFIEHLVYKQPMSVFSAFLLTTVLQTILYSTDKNNNDAKKRD